MPIVVAYCPPIRPIQTTHYKLDRGPVCDSVMKIRVLVLRYLHLPMLFAPNPRVLHHEPGERFHCSLRHSVLKKLDMLGNGVSPGKLNLCG